MQWPFRITYGTFANYSPRGNSPLSADSRSKADAIKRGSSEVIGSILPYLRQDEFCDLASLLSPKTVLVPIPRSALQMEDHLWPSMLIANTLHSGGFGAEVLPLVTRTSPLPRSSKSGADRPTVWAQRNSMAVVPDLIEPDSITLIDDVLTLGRTSIGCALLLRERFQSATISTFAILRTQSRIADIERLIEPVVGTLSLRQNGFIDRDPD